MFVKKIDESDCILESGKSSGTKEELWRSVTTSPDFSSPIGSSFITNPWNIWKILHPIFLYFLVVLLYSELKSVQETVQDMRLQILNLSIRQLDFELRFIKNVTLKKLNDLDPSIPAREGKHDLHRRSVPRTKVPRENQKSRAPLAIHLVGAQPEAEVRDEGLIAPWIPDTEGLGTFSLPTNTTLRDSGSYLFVSRPGLYLIYAQIFYLNAQQQNSFAVTSEDKGGSRRTLAICSASNFSGPSSELGCFTAFVRFMKGGDKIFLVQREKRRLILFRDGQSFFGLVLLRGRA